VLQRSLFAPFIVRLDSLALPYFVTGSTAGIAYGGPRMTNDVDRHLHRVRRAASLGARSPPHGRARWLARAGRPPPEYVILRKLDYFREGKSEKHLRDIRGMLDISGDQIDRSFLARWIERMGLAAEWDRVTVDRTM
jgi:hypothetical protein